MNDFAATSFDRVREEEIAHIARATARPAEAVDIAAKERPKTSAPIMGGPVGLAFSGGGIRSATFCLGVLQALALKDKLNRFDYLSTVSGGGYIGSWLSAWIHRKGFASVETALKQSAATGSVDPPELQWLRRYSNYLTPRVGMLSADALTVVATWLRNVFLNALILVALIGATHLAVVASLPLLDSFIQHLDVTGWVATALTVGGLCAVALNLTIQYWKDKAKIGNTSKPPIAPAILKPKWVLFLCVLPFMAAAAVGAVWLLSSQFGKGDWIKHTKDVVWLLAIALAVVTVVAHAVNLGVRVRRAGNSAMSVGQVWRALKDARTHFLAGAVSLSAGVGLCALLVQAWPTQSRLPTNLLHAANVVPMITFGPAVMLLIFGICITLFIGMVGRAYREDSREWWSRLGGWLAFMGLCWLVFMLLTFYIPPWIAAAWYLAPGWGNAIAGSFWAASIPTVFKVLGTINKPKQDDTTLKGILINVAIAVFAVGIFVLIAAAVGLLVNDFSGKHYPVPGEPPYPVAIAEYVTAFHMSLDALRDRPTIGWWTLKTAIPMACYSAAVGLLVAVILAWRVDINRFSLHNMYKNRLIRCYLGASNDRRNAQPFTGFDREDDMPLKDLVTTATKEAQRPFHIINTALNLVQGADLAWQERKAASFVLTPKYCGFQLGQSQGNSNPTLSQPELLAFRPTSEYASTDPNGEDRGFSLGMAMATSGAAASPNQGFHSQPSLAVLMTFFNIRLGRWSPNPARHSWKRSSPKFGLAYLLAELTGYSNEARDFVYLSDGGHFENMAVYELVRRKCSVIVAVDCGADPDRAFDDLGNMIRKCRIDFGVEIEIEMTSLFGEGPAKLSTECFGFGTIYYDKSGKSGPNGTLIYLKPSLKNQRKEAVDLLNYKTTDNSFPQQTTADQWFDESQFESYRKLGFETGCECMEKYGALLP